MNRFLYIVLLTAPPENYSLTLALKQLIFQVGLVSKIRNCLKMSTLTRVAIRHRNAITTLIKIKISKQGCDTLQL